MNGVVIVLPLALLLVAVVTQLGANGVIKRNGFVGFRIPSTLRSDVEWLAGHKAAVAPLWIGFAVATVAGLAALLTEGAFQFVAAVYIAFIAALVFSVIAAGRGARAARELESSAI